MMPASVEDCEEALEVVHGAMGLGPANADEAGPFFQRLRETAVILATAEPTWSVAALREAGRALARSPRLDDKIRYGRPITAADFERQRAGEERTVRDPDSGDERVIVTLKGFALKVAAAKLYTHGEAIGLWRAAGEPGRFSDGVRPDGTLATYPDSMFTVCEVEDAGRRFRLK